MLEAIAPLLRKLSYRQNLSIEEARQALNVAGEEDAILTSDASDGLYLLALTLGLMAKGPTTDELYGLALSVQENSARFRLGLDPASIIDISGTGGDSLKTLNVSTAASFVLAASGVYVAKQATGAYTSTTGSADIFKELGHDVFSSSDVGIFETTLRELGVAGFYPPAFSDRFRNRIAFLRKLRSIGLIYLTPWHLVAWVPSPVAMESRVYGVFNPDYIEPLAQVFIRLGYRRGLVVHGTNGLDEISNIGVTRICEFQDGKMETYEVTPEELGVPRSRREDIESQGREDNLERFFRVLLGLDRGPRRDLVAVNAGCGLYAIGKAPSLSSGVERALEALESGAAAAKLEAFATYHGAADRLNAWKVRLGL